MTSRKDRRVRFLPKKAADVVPIIRWHVEMRLWLIQEVACGPQASGTGAPGKEEAMERIQRSLGRDWRAEEEAIVDYMRAEVREWWQDFPERRLLTGLYGRVARRRAGCGSDDSRRRPSHAEGLRVARELLSDIPDTSGLDSEREYAAVSRVLADQWLPPIGVRSPDTLLEYIERSEASRVYFDALELICEELDSGGEAVPDPLARWRQEAAGWRRRRPDREPLPPYRPVNPAHLLRDLQLQFTIAVLQRLGVPPNGRPVSGYRIVSEALGLSEDTVKRIWNKPFTPEMQKHWKAIATHTGLSQYHH